MNLEKERLDLLNENTIEPLLYVISGFCYLGRDSEDLFESDPNSFIAAFRHTDEELFTSISIRMSAIDFFDNCVFRSSKTSASLSTIRRVFETIFQN